MTILKDKIDNIKKVGQMTILVKNNNFKGKKDYSQKYKKNAFNCLQTVLRVGDIAPRDRGFPAGKHVLNVL